MMPLVEEIGITMMLTKVFKKRGRLPVTETDGLWRVYGRFEGKEYVIKIQKVPGNERTVLGDTEVGG